jgi:hypothetical protein
MRAIMPFIDDGSYDRQFMREDGGPNKEFLTFLFYNNDLAIQFLQDVGLLRRKVQCNKCDRDMTWCASGIKKGSGTRYANYFFRKTYPERLGFQEMLFLEKRTPKV